MTALNDPGHPDDQGDDGLRDYPPPIPFTGKLLLWFSNVVNYELKMPTRV
jgi:hypothetical protein